MTKVKRGRKPVERDPRWIALGKQLVSLRNARGWRAYEVAAMIGVDPATISQIENGKRATGPERDTLEHLAKLYQVSLETLTGAEPQHYETKASRHPPGDVSVTGPVLELADIRAAVSDAIFAVFADIFESITESRVKRATTDSRRETDRAGASATARAGRG
jgi:transcriptional regulator with XRE-family HTH domain